MNDFENKQNVLNDNNNDNNDNYDNYDHYHESINKVEHIKIDENFENTNNGKKIKIIEGDSKELNISKVKDSLPFESSENCEKNNRKDDIDVLQSKLENNKYLTMSPNFMQTSETSKDLTVATKKIPKAGENRVILYAIIFISIIASILFIKYYKVNKIIKS